jgi:hypothetical protein
MKSYTYLWLREDGTPYYVGKGRKCRATETHRAGHKLSPPPTDRIILQEWPNEELALEAERFLIAYYGRKDLGTGCLRNLTDGGEGITGVKFSSETLKRKRAAGKVSGFKPGHVPANKGKKTDPEVLARLSVIRTGKLLGHPYWGPKKRSEESKRKTSISGKLAWIARKARNENTGSLV